MKFDVAPTATREWAGQIFAALFGEETPMTAPAPSVRRTVVRIDPDCCTLVEIAKEGLYRPIDVRFNPVDGVLYIINFGRFEMHGERGVLAEAGTGRLWRLVSKLGR